MAKAAMGWRVAYYYGSPMFSQRDHHFNNSPCEYQNNGMIGTVLGGKNPIAIDCNPLGDDAIYIDGIVSTYSPW